MLPGGSDLHSATMDANGPLARRRFLSATLASGVAAMAAVDLAKAASAGEDKPKDPPAGGDGRSATIQLDPLPYAPEALEPAIDAETMRIHHGKHHAAYVKNLQDALKKIGSTAPLVTLLGNIGAIPAEVRTAVRNNGGGHFNHTLFWNVIAPPGSGGAPSPELTEALDRDVGGVDAFRKAITAKAMGQFGSGWAWLLVKPDGKLAVTSTPNQDCPIMVDVVEQPGTPIFGIDVWEHAYYLKHQNRRADYVEALLGIINWKSVSERFRESTKR
jgi:Fe-Mn family superoxide dismutase